MKRIYLDANGSCPALAEAREEILRSMDLIGNPSSFHHHGRVLRARLDEARSIVAQAVNAQEKEVIFTSGASEANRLFVESLQKWHQASDKKLRVVMSPFEHPSLLNPVLHACEQGFWDLHIMDVDKEGRLNIDDNILKNCDVLIACSAHNETGMITDIGALIDQLKPGALVMSDISQGFSRLKAPDGRIDVLTFSAQKMGGFSGVGGAVFRGQAKSLPSPWLGGGQERGFRPGTECWLLIMAFMAAAREVEHIRQAHSRLEPLRDHFEARLKKAAIMKVLGQEQKRLPNTSAISFFNEDPDALRIACDMAGLSVGFGAACSGLAPQGSFALKRLGLSFQEEKTTVRFSFLWDLTRKDIDDAIERLVTRVLSHRSRA